MNNYKLEDDGSLLAANAPTSLVEQMRNSSKFASDESIENFMRGFAERYKIDTGIEIRFDDEANFVADLSQCEYLKIVT